VVVVAVAVNLMERQHQGELAAVEMAQLEQNKTMEP
jgi:hypothetical protein